METKPKKNYMNSADTKTDIYNSNSKYYIGQSNNITVTQFNNGSPNKVNVQNDNNNKFSNQKPKIQNNNLNKKHTRQQFLDELSQLKKGLDNKKSKTNNEIVVEKVNKTTVGRIINTKQKIVEQSEHTEQLNIILTMAISKKKQNYIQLKRWDQSRSQLLGFHRNVVEQLQNQLDKRIKCSIQNMEIYTNYFRQKAKQQQRYINQLISNTRQKTQINPVAKNIYITCTSLLNILNDSSEQKITKILNFFYLIKKNIIKQRLEVHINESQLQLLKIREKISVLKSDLQKYNLETQKKSKKLAIYFNQTIQNKGFNAEKDFYKSQLSFLRKADLQLNTQKKLGQYCIQYLKISILEEKKRVEVIKQCVLLYMKGLKQTYEFEYKEEDYQQLYHQQQGKMIDQMFKLENIMNGRVLKLLKQKCQVKSESELSIETFINYINNFSFPQFNNKLLLLKQYNVLYEILKDKSEPCILVLTVDGFAHLFANKQDVSKYQKPLFTIKIDQTLKIKAISDVKIELRKKPQKKAGMMSYLIWDNKNQPGVVVRFSKKDSREQFSDYIKKMI